MTTIRLALLMPMVLVVSGCAHSVSDSYGQYLQSKKGIFAFPKTDAQAQYYVAPQVLNHAYEFSSVMAGAANVWQVKIGSMLADTLASDDYRGSFASLSESTSDSSSDGLLFKYEHVSYLFTETQARISLKIVIDQNGKPILSKTYTQNGIGQGGKMFWAGAFGMENAIHQSTKTALDQILADSLADFEVALHNPPDPASISITGWRQNATDDEKALAIAMAELTLQYEKGEISNAEYLQRQNKLNPDHKQHATPGEMAYAVGIAELNLQYAKGEIGDAAYMQKQRELVNEHSKEIKRSLGIVTTSAAPVAIGAKRFRVALFPSGPVTPGAPSNTDALLSAYAHQYIDDHKDMELVFSDYDPSFERGSVGSVTNVWIGTFTSKSPNDPQIFSGAKKVGANVALLFSHKKRTAGWYGDDFIVTVYVINLETKKRYRLQGDELNFERTINQAFSRLLAN